MVLPANFDEHADDDPEEARQLRHGAKRSPVARGSPEGAVGRYLSIPSPGLGDAAVAAAGTPEPCPGAKRDSRKALADV